MDVHIWQERSLTCGRKRSLLPVHACKLPFFQACREKPTMLPLSLASSGPSAAEKEGENPHNMLISVVVEEGGSFPALATYQKIPFLSWCVCMYACVYCTIAPPSQIGRGEGYLLYCHRRRSSPPPTTHSVYSILHGIATAKEEKRDSYTHF